MGVPKADLVDVSVLQGALTQSGLTKSEVARRLGWTRDTPDTCRVRRVLGECASGGKKPPQKAVSYGMATQVLSAMGFDPVDFGL